MMTIHLRRRSMLAKARNSFVLAGGSPSAGVELLLAGHGRRLSVRGLQAHCRPARRSQVRRRAVVVGWKGGASCPSQSAVGLAYMSVCTASSSESPGDLVGRLGEARRAQAERVRVGRDDADEADVDEVPGELAAVARRRSRSSPR